MTYYTRSGARRLAHPGGPDQVGTTNGWVPSSDRCCSCSSSEATAFKATAYDGRLGELVDVVECRNCGFAWQFPVSRTIDDSAVAFSAAYAGCDEVKSRYFDPRHRMDVASIELDFLEALPIAGRRLLDVGGGDGSFALAAQRRGWLVTAVDPAIDPSRLTEGGLSAIRGTTQDLSPHVVFDVVTLWDVIEHVEDPHALLEDLRRRVSVGGWLIVETGNYKCAERVRSSTDHWIYHLDHRWYFAPESLTRLLESMGWEVVDRARRVLRPEWRGREDYPGPTLRSLISRCVRSPHCFVRHFRRHWQLRSAVKWPQSGLEIFCLAVRRVQ